MAVKIGLLVIFRRDWLRIRCVRGI